MLPVAIMVKGSEIFIMPLGFYLKHLHNYCHCIQALLIEVDLQVVCYIYSKRALGSCYTEICFIQNSYEFVPSLH